MMMRRLNLSRRKVTIASLTTLSLIWLAPSLLHSFRLTLSQGVWCSVSEGDEMGSPRVIRYGRDCP
jgi:hypothetical protein